VTPGSETHEMELNEITRLIIGCAMRVHSALGPGLLESVYRTCLCHELTKCGLRFEKEVLLPITYDGIVLDGCLRIDLLVEGSVIVETKAVTKPHPIHKAQLLSYLKLSTRPVGLLINFNVIHLRDGIRRLVN
jgi:GxxExxY protein